MTEPVIADTASDHDADVAAVQAVIADTERAFNTNDPDLLNADRRRSRARADFCGTHKSAVRRLAATTGPTGGPPFTRWTPVAPQPARAETAGVGSRLAPTSLRSPGDQQGQGGEWQFNDEGQDE
jgi:hypothetical protein